METPMGKHHHIPPDAPPPLPERKPARQLAGLFENGSCNPIPMFESPVFSPSDGTITPKGKGCTIPMFESPVFSPANGTTTPKGKGCRKRVSPATSPRNMDWSFFYKSNDPRDMDWCFCKSNDSRPLHTLPFFTENLVLSIMFKVGWRLLLQETRPGIQFGHKSSFRAGYLTLDEEGKCYVLAITPQVWGTLHLRKYRIF